MLKSKQENNGNNVEDDEHDTDNIIEEITSTNPMMIRGELPGTGKKLFAPKHDRTCYNLIFVCPTNKLLQAFEGDALTVNQFFGINFGDAELEPCDYSDYDVYSSF